MTRGLVLWVLVASASLVAQVTPLLTNGVVCQDLNAATDVSEGTVTLPPANSPFAGGGTVQVAIRIVPTQTIILGGVEVLIQAATPVPIFPAFTILVYDEDPVTGLPNRTIGSSAGASSPGPPMPGGLVWHGAGFQYRPILVSGGTYWITLAILGNQPATFATQNVTGPDVTPYRLGGSFAVPFSWDPMLTNERFKLRLINDDCSQTTTASVTSVGVSFPQVGGPTLVPSGLPSVGRGSFGLSIVGAPPGVSAMLVAAPTADPVGTVVIPPNGTLFLDLPGTLAAFAAGTNPIGQGLTGPTGVRIVSLPIGPFPSLIGLSAAFQGLVLDPSGAPTGNPGVSITMTQAIVATIGT